MKFNLFVFPTIPATSDERAALRPIAQKTHKFQQMLNEIREIARVAEDLGFDTISTTEHHLHEEGLEMGCTASFHHWIASHTKHVRVGPVGYVLPSWNPLRLAVETAWLDQLTQGRAIVGMARGYQTRWFQNMAQKYGSEINSTDAFAAHSPGVASSATDDINRAVYEAE
jgi:alkanesulfonate monooxygenase SsuD/methylene tetrahydromethanopterin reductase-like flavin-dependent oxidoreductase (luciferase family)